MDGSRGDPISRESLDNRVKCRYRNVTIFGNAYTLERCYLRSMLTLVQIFGTQRDVWLYRCFHRIHRFYQIQLVSLSGYMILGALGTSFSRNVSSVFFLRLLIFCSRFLLWEFNLLLRCENSNLPLTTDSSGLSLVFTITSLFRIDSLRWSAQIKIVYN